MRPLNLLLAPCRVDTFERLSYDSTKSSVADNLVERITDRRQFDVVSVSKADDTQDKLNKLFCIC